MNVKPKKDSKDWKLPKNFFLRSYEPGEVEFIQTMDGREIPDPIQRPLSRIEGIFKIGSEPILMQLECSNEQALKLIKPFLKKASEKYINKIDNKSIKG